MYAISKDVGEGSTSGVPPDRPFLPNFCIPPPKKKTTGPQAYGEAACSVLNFLTDKALSATGFVWRRPVYAAEDTAEEAEPVDDCDMADIADEAEVEEEQEDEQDFSDLIKVK